MPKKGQQNSDQESSDNTCAILERKRHLLQAKLSRFTLFLNALKETRPDSSKLIELDTRLKDLESHLLSEFCEIQFQLEGIDFEAYHEDEDIPFETQYYTIISDAKKLIFDISNPQPSSGPSVSSELQLNNSNNAQKIFNVKLPVIELPKFTGNYGNWLEFKELYLSLIHSNKTLDSIQKLHYLKASLDGSALQCIQSIHFSSENYEIAWKILCERFDNKRLMIHNLIKSLFNIPQLLPDCPGALRNLVDLISKHLSSLNAIGVKTEFWDPLIIYLICTKLDQPTVCQWEQTEFADELPKISELKTFLNHRADYLDKVNLHKPKSKNFTKSSKHIPESACLFNNVEASEQVSMGFGGKNKRFSCFNCNQPHSIYKCQQFLLRKKRKGQGFKIMWKLPM